MGGAVRTNSYIAPNSYNSDIEDHWPQITITHRIKIKMFEILQELPKCDRDMQWENAIGKMALIDLLDPGLPQTFIL